MRVHLAFFRRSPLLLACGLFFCFAQSGKGQAPAWQSVAVPTSSSPTTITSSAVDANGNVYICGNFSGAVSFGAVTLSSAGSTDIFVAKWQPATNTYAWAQSISGASWDFAADIAVTSAGIYVTGSSGSPAISFNSTVLTNSGASGSVRFVAKLLEGGAAPAYAWAQAISGNNATTEINSLTVLGSNIYVAGTFQGTEQFGSSVRTSAGAGDVYVAKLVDAGQSVSFGWVQQAGGTLDDHGFGMVGAGNSLYLSGSFQGTISLGNTTLTERGGTDAFVAKLVDAGAAASFAWAEHVGSATPANNSTSIGALALSGQSLYLAGGFGQSIALGSITLTQPFGNSEDLYIAKLTDNGSSAAFQWARQAGGRGEDTAHGLAVVGQQVYVAGRFGSPTILFGSTVLNNTDPSTWYTKDVYIAKLTDSGSSAGFAWALQAGSIEDYEGADGIAIHGNRVFVTGSVVTPATFGSLILAGRASTAAGFLASLTDLALPAAAPVVLKDKITVLPNPARTEATVRVAGMNSPLATLTLVDALGRAVRTQPVAGASAELSLRGLAPGLYQVRVQAGGQQLSQRLVVE